MLSGSSEEDSVEQPPDSDDGRDENQTDEYDLDSGDERFVNELMIFNFDDDTMSDVSDL